MRTHIVKLTAALLAGTLLTTTAFAQGRPCAARDKIISRLNDAYGETVQSMGLGSNNGMMEVFASEETGTWTITLTSPDGVMCLIASGQAFEGLDGTPLVAPGEDA